jgi:hypothetical protein
MMAWSYRIESSGFGEISTALKRSQNSPEGFSTLLRGYEKVLRRGSHKPERRMKGKEDEGKGAITLDDQKASIVTLQQFERKLKRRRFSNVSRKNDGAEYNNGGGTCRY